MEVTILLLPTVPTRNENFLLEQIVICKEKWISQKEKLGKTQTKTIAL